MPGQELADYLAYILASAHRSMRMGLSESIDDSDLTEEHWRILHVLSDEQGRSMGERRTSAAQWASADQKHRQAREPGIGPASR